MFKPRARILMVKTSLDGHWRGVHLVAHALRDAGFEVILAGAANPDEIMAAVRQEDVDIVGLNVGGRVEVVERILDRLAVEAPGVPVMAGGTIAPWAARRLTSRGVSVFPPGSSLEAITTTALELARASAEHQGHLGDGSAR